MLEVEVVVRADADVEVLVDEEEEEEEDDDEEEEEDDDDDVVAAAPPGLPIMAADATAGPVVLIEATEVPLGKGKKLFESVLSQQTLDAFRL